MPSMYPTLKMNIVHAPVFDNYRFLRDENDLPLPSIDFLADGINANNPKSLADIQNFFFPGSFLATKLRILMTFTMAAAWPAKGKTFVLSPESLSTI